MQNARFVKGKHEYFPIPQSVIDICGAEVMKQNPGFKRGKFVERLQEFDTKQIIKLALIGGLDCFFVGVGCYYMNLPYLMESLVLFLIVLAGYMIHFYIGYYNGAGYQKAYYFLCGVVYLFMSLSLIFKLIRL